MKLVGLTLLSTAGAALGRVGRETSEITRETHREWNPETHEMMSTPPVRIIGGSLPTVDYPYMASLSSSGGGDIWAYCGGSLIAPQWVLTAAHCVDQGEKGYYITVGHSDTDNHASRTEQRKVINTIRHGSYSPSTLKNDIALVQLESPITSIDTIAYDFNHDDYASAGDTVTVIGFGNTAGGGSGDPAPVPVSDPTKLLEVDVDITTTAKCQAAYGNDMTPTEMICAGTRHEDACQGDSGGPLLKSIALGQDVQVGVVSWGIGCGVKDYPGVYTRVKTYVNWIKNNMNDISPVPLSTPMPTVPSTQTTVPTPEYEISEGEDVPSPSTDWVLGASGRSCDTVCNNQAASCKVAAMNSLTSLSKMKNVLNLIGSTATCSSQGDNQFKDAPCLDGDGSDSDNCYYDGSLSTCSAQWDSSRRVCCCGSNCPTGGSEPIPTPTPTRPPQDDPYSEPYSSEYEVEYDFNPDMPIVEGVDSEEKFLLALQSGLEQPKIGSTVKVIVLSKSLTLSQSVIIDETMDVTIMVQQGMGEMNLDGITMSADEGFGITNLGILRVMDVTLEMDLTNEGSFFMNYGIIDLQQGRLMTVADGSVAVVTQSLVKGGNIDFANPNGASSFFLANGQSCGWNNDLAETAALSYSQGSQMLEACSNEEIDDSPTLDPTPYPTNFPSEEPTPYATEYPSVPPSPYETNFPTF